jgi:hypothetical protein
MDIRGDSVLMSDDSWQTAYEYRISHHGFDGRAELSNGKGAVARTFVAAFLRVRGAGVAAGSVARFQRHLIGVNGPATGAARANARAR